MITETNYPNQTRPVDGYERMSSGADDRRRMSTQSLGKLPPQATDLEEVILGALLLEREALFTINEFLKPNHFYKDANQKVYHAIIELFARNEPIDMLTVKHELQQRGELEIIGGAYYLVDLTHKVASSANIEYHARIVYQKYLQREMIRIATIVIGHAYEDTADVFDLLEQNQRALFQLSEFHQGQQADLIDTLIQKEIDDLEVPVHDGITGVGTGFRDLDKFCSGWQKNELTIIAARPAMGKTGLAMQLARNAAVIHKKPTAVFSLEMSKSQLTQRMISNETEIFLEKLKKKTLTDTDKKMLDEKLWKVRNSPILIDDTPSLSIVAFRSKALRLKKLYGIELIIIDYLQLMTGKEGNREQEIGSITRGMKKVAKELDVAIIALSQLSRAVENRVGGSKRPQLSDLRESGSIEQDADNVFFIYRPEYYGITEVDKQSTQGLAELICAKHRNGPCDTINLKFRGALVRFEDWYGPVGSPGNEQAVLPFVIRESADNDNEPPF